MKVSVSVIGIWIVLLSISFPVFAQTNDIISKLKAYNETHPAEKAYLHFDKPYYAAGDTIYFKAYVTMGERHDLSKISGVLHVDLINTANKADQAILLQVINGIAWGDFALPDSLPAGNYRIRAYTRWMRNRGDDNYFEKIIPVGTILRQQIPESNTAKIKTTAINKPDLQFFPEGGNMINGIRSKIAFKAIGSNGLGMDLRGEVTDNTGRVIAKFQSARLGMGYFWLMPEPGKTYKAGVTYADGTKDIIALPAADEKGITLSVDNDSLASAAVKIEASPAYYQENKGKDYSLLVYSGGYATTVNCKLDSPVIRMDIIKRRLFTGITTITLFSGREPLCERLLFAQNFDQLTLDIHTDRDSYVQRGKVNLKLNARNRADSAVIGHFSIAVVDESKVAEDENNETTILTDLLLTSDMKGYIEQPNYYFTDVTGDKLKDLDLVMLTHGYRKFDWKKVFSSDSTSNAVMAYQPERSLAISGVAKNLLGKPLPKATVSLISLETRRFASDTTDSKGHFSFGNLFFTDTARFILQAVNAKGKNHTQLTYEQEKPPVILPMVNVSQTANGNTLMPVYLENDEKEREEMNKFGLGKGKMLKEVEIKARKIDKPVETSRYGVADQVINGDKILYGGSLAIRLMGLIKGVHFVNTGGNSFKPVLNVPSPGGPKPMLIVWNDQEMPLDFDIGAINTGSVEKIEVITNATAITPVYDGIIIITTANGLQAKDIVSTGILPITAHGFHKARIFYSPKYEHPDDNLNHKDLRSTIYWQPELVTDKDGNASIDYYNADGTGNYRVVVEGIDEKGNIGRQVYRYKVE